MDTLHVVVMRCCFRCDHPMHGDDGHCINDCKHVPSVEEQVGLDCSVWGSRWGTAEPSGKDAFLAKQLARQQGTVLGANYVTTASSQPYTCPGVPHPVHVFSSFGLGLYAISVPDTSRESLTTISHRVLPFRFDLMRVLFPLSHVLLEFILSGYLQVGWWLVRIDGQVLKFMRLL